MTRQKSDKGVVPEGLRKLAPTETGSRGGKALAVNEEASSPSLRKATAENPTAPAKGIVARAEEGRPESARDAVPKASTKGGRVSSAMMEEIVLRLGGAFERVAKNKGAPGPDRQSIEEVRAHLPEILSRLKRDLLSGHYMPGDVRRAWIPKPGGGQRGLGIPNVVDRIVQEAVREVLEPLYEPTFHPSSHGFRPGRSCHTAIAQAESYLEEGNSFVVDIDLEKFFDRVCHQRLLARLAKRVKAKDVLRLVGKMLKAGVVMPDGVVVSTEEGLPQGGPLSPLLSNIVLDELDWELERRGHSFVRYADDCNIYVRSERAGQRVMASISGYLGKRMRLKVNAEKSAVSRPEERHFLGFSLRRSVWSGQVEVRLSERTKKRARAKVVELTPRNWGQSLQSCIQRINSYLRGWFGFFGICSAHEQLMLRALDAHTRRRLRAIQLKQWKRKRTIARKLIKLGVSAKATWRRIYQGSRSTWYLSHDHTVEKGLSNAFFSERGLVSLLGLWKARQNQHIKVPKQLELPWG